MHAGRFATRPRGRLARRLLDKLPETFRRVCYGSNGSDAVEASLKAGVHIGTASDVLLLAPPLIFSDHDIDELLAALSGALARLDAQCH